MKKELEKKEIAKQIKVLFPDYNEDYEPYYGEIDKEAIEYLNSFLKENIDMDRDIGEEIKEDMKEELGVLETKQLIINI